MDYVIEMNAIGGPCWVATGGGDPERTHDIERAEVYATEREAMDNAWAFRAKYPARKFVVRRKTPKYLIKSGDVEVTADTLAEVLGVVNDREFHGLDASTLVVTMPGFADAQVPLVKNNYGKIGIAIAGEHDVALESLLTPVLPNFIRDGKPLAPWQMPRKQWMSLVAIGSLAYDVIPGLDKTLPRRTYTSLFNGEERQVGITDWLNRFLLRKLHFGHNGPEYKLGHGGVNSRHDVHVAYALANDKPVPAEAIADMLQSFTGGNFDLSFARAVAERPFLRGRVNVDQLQALLNVYERECKLVVTEDNAEALFAIARSLGEDPSYTQVDDALWAARLIPALPAKIHPIVETQPIQPSGPMAEALMLQMVIHQTNERIGALNEQLRKGQIAVRSYEQDRDLYMNLASHSSSASWANRVVAGLEGKDIPFLLQVLDCPDDQNKTSKRFAREHFGLNVLNLKANDRTAAVFRYCGLDASQQTAWEVRNAEAKRLATAERDAKEARESAIHSASSHKVKDEAGVVYTWKDLIDRRIAEGFSEMTMHRQGAIMKNYMKNPATGGLMPVQRKDGSLAYAQLAVSNHKAAAAEATVQVDGGEAPREREAQRG